jgi:hypothetical protein
MPKDAFLREPDVEAPGVREWGEESLFILSRRYGASQEAVLRRLVALERASWDYYVARRSQYLMAYEELRRQEVARRRQAGPGGPPPARMAIRDRGRPYVELALDAYQRDVITPSTLSRMLGLKLKHLSSLQRELGG